jgi:hypothetical protein
LVNQGVMNQGRVMNDGRVMSLDTS